jgi:hypothetical protein
VAEKGVSGKNEKTFRGNIVELCSEGRLCQEHRGRKRRRQQEQQPDLLAVAARQQLGEQDEGGDIAATLGRDLPIVKHYSLTNSVSNPPHSVV